MISAPDFKEKQILHVHTDWGKPSRLSFRNDNIVFEKERKIVNRVSVHKTFAVFISGDLSLTTNFIKRAKEHGVSVFFLKNNLEMYGGLLTEAEGHYVLRGKQYGMSEVEQLNMAKKLVANKVFNQIALLKQRTEGDERKTLTLRAEDAKLKIVGIDNHHELLGTEGNYSRQYFKEHFASIGWRRRAPRTKEDIPNLLMDIGYTMLFNFTDSLLRLHGFDTYKGFYHRLFFQRRSLACDIMEPMRPLIDKQILKMYNLKQVSEKDFTISQGVYALPFENQPKYAGSFLKCLMNEKSEIFDYVHGFYQHVMAPEKYSFPEYYIKP